MLGRQLLEHVLGRQLPVGVCAHRYLQLEQYLLQPRRFHVEFLPRRARAPRLFNHPRCELAALTRFARGTAAPMVAPAPPPPTAPLPTAPAPLAAAATD